MVHGPTSHPAVTLKRCRGAMLLPLSETSMKLTVGRCPTQTGLKQNKQIWKPICSMCVCIYVYDIYAYMYVYIYVYIWHICLPDTHHCMYLLYYIFCDDVAPSTASPGSFRWLLRISAKSFRKLHQLSSESLLLKPITPQSNNLTGFFGGIEMYKSLPITHNINLEKSSHNHSQT
jgi:hypothetical protein